MDWEQAGIMKLLAINKVEIFGPIFPGTLHGGQGSGTWLVDCIKAQKFVLQFQYGLIQYQIQYGMAYWRQV